MLTREGTRIFVRPGGESWGESLERLSVASQQLPPSYVGGGQALRGYCASSTALWLQPTRVQTRPPYTCFPWPPHKCLPTTSTIVRRWRKGFSSPLRHLYRLSGYNPRVSRLDLPTPASTIVHRWRRNSPSPPRSSTASLATTTQSTSTRPPRK